MEYSLQKVHTQRAMGSKSTASPFAKIMLAGRRSSVNGLVNSAKNTAVIVRDEMMLKLLLRTADQPLFPIAENVSSENCVSAPRDENTPPPGTEQQILPNNCHWIEGKPLEKGATPEYSEMSSSPKTPINRGDYQTWENYPSMCLIQRELDGGQPQDHSRDKSARKNSSKDFNNYDEQRKITGERKTHTGLAKSIQEVMKDVVVYVEVRTGEDNRSAGVKKVISQLGAKVNDKLLRDTTHVVFKDGLQSTYNKAKKWNIPLVSILWIEECKKQMKLMDPALFPISNFDRYENPDLYGRFKRIKSMQPDAEEDSRRNRSKTIKETEIAKTAKINSALVVPRKPKDKLDEILYEFQEKLLSTPDDNGDCLPFESKLLQRIKNSPFTPKSHKEQNKTGIKSILKGDEFPAVSEQDEEYDNSSQPHARKSLKFHNAQRVIPDSRLAAGALKETKSEGDFSMSATASKRTTRSSSISATAVSTESSAIKDKTKSIRRRTLYTVSEQPIKTTSNSVEKSTSSKISTSRLATKNIRRRTLFTPNSKEVSGPKRTIVSYFPKEVNRRKKNVDPEEIVEESTDLKEQLTQFDMEAKTVEVVEDEKIDCKRNRTSLTLLEEHSSSLLFSSTRTPQLAKRRTLFDISMDIIDQRLQTINKSAKQNKMRRDSIDSEHSTTPVNQLRTANSIIDLNSPVELGDQTLTEVVNKNEKSPSTDISENVPKKRKLFAPVDITSSPAVASLLDIDNLKTATKKRVRKCDEAPNTSKKRRTLFGPAPLVEDSPALQAKPNRRRTMGFDVIRKIAASHGGAKAELAVPFLV